MRGDKMKQIYLILFAFFLLQSSQITRPINPVAGENNTGSNLEAGDAQVFKQKTGVDLEFRA